MKMRTFREATLGDPLGTKTRLRPLDDTFFMEWLHDMHTTHDQLMTFDGLLADARHADAGTTTTRFIHTASHFHSLPIDSFTSCFLSCLPATRTLERSLQIAKRAPKRLRPPLGGVASLVPYQRLTLGAQSYTLGDFVLVQWHDKSDKIVERVAKVVGLLAELHFRGRCKSAAEDW